jgi:hypothetical protein
VSICETCLVRFVPALARIRNSPKASTSTMLDEEELLIFEQAAQWLKISRSALAER